MMAYHIRTLRKSLREGTEEAAEFWERHDLVDYWDVTSAVHFDVDIQRRVFLTALNLNWPKSRITIVLAAAA